MISVKALVAMGRERAFSLMCAYRETAHALRLRAIDDRERGLDFLAIHSNASALDYELDAEEIQLWLASQLTIETTGVDVDLVDERAVA